MTWNKLKMEGKRRRAGKGNRGGRGFYGQSIIFSMGLWANNDPKNSWHQKAASANLSVDLFRCGRTRIILWFFKNFPRFSMSWPAELQLYFVETLKKNQSHLLCFCFRWRKRNHLSYLRTKSNYEASALASGTMAASTLPPERLLEHPLIYDDANIHFYRTSGTSSYLLDSSRGPSRSTMVRDISSLSSQVH